MNKKIVSIILSLLLSLSLFSTALAETPEANLKRTIDKSKDVLQTNSIAEQLVNSLIELSNSLVRFENGIEVKPLQAPTGLKVESNILSWNRVENSESYEIIIKNTKTTAEQKINLTETLKDISSLIDFGVEYSIKVKEIADVDYSSSEYSNEIKYTKTKTALSTPTDLNVDSKTNILSWKQVANAKSYDIILKNNVGVERPPINSTETKLDIGSMLPFDKEYSMKVKAIADPAGIYKDSEYSSYLKYTKTKPALDTPTELKIDSKTNILSWKQVPNARSYEIILINTETNVEKKINSTTTTKDISSDMDFDAEYSIKVKAIAEGDYSDSKYSSIIKYTKLKTTLITPTELSVDTNLLSWKQVPNAESYEIILINTETNVEKKINSTTTTKDISLDIDFGIEYAIKVKAIADPVGGYKDSEYSSEIKYIKEEVVGLQAPVITSIDLEDIISKTTETNPQIEADRAFKLALNLKWSYIGDESFVVKITEGANTIEVKVPSGQRQLRLNQYINKDTTYTIGILAKQGANESKLSNTKTYTAKNVCGHTNGFMFAADYDTGTKAYAITTPAQFEHINQHAVVGPVSADFLVQMNDIDFNGKKYTNNIVGQMANRYDGQSFMVDNFEIEGVKVGAPHIGVFGDLTNNTKIKDFGVGSKAVITAHAGYVGGVVGYGYCRIYRCYNFATIKSDGETKGTGGITGCAMFGLAECYNSGTIISEGNSATGGLVGLVDISSTASVSIWNSYNSGSVTGKNSTGGLVGSLVDGRLTFGNSYNTGKISGVTGKMGALIGTEKVNSGQSIYYLDSSVSTPSAVGVAKTDSYMQSVNFINDLMALNYKKFFKTANYIYPDLINNPHRNLN